MDKPVDTKPGDYTAARIKFLIELAHTGSLSNFGVKELAKAAQRLMRGHKLKDRRNVKG